MIEYSNIFNIFWKYLIHKFFSKKNEDTKNIKQIQKNKNHSIGIQMEGINIINVFDNKYTLNNFSNYISDPDVYVCGSYRKFVAYDNDLDLATHYKHRKNFDKKSRQVVGFLAIFITCLGILITIFADISWNKAEIRNNEHKVQTNTYNGYQEIQKG